MREFLAEILREESCWGGDLVLMPSAETPATREDAADATQASPPGGAAGCAVAEGVVAGRGVSAGGSDPGVAPTEVAPTEVAPTGVAPMEVAAADAVTAHDAGGRAPGLEEVRRELGECTRCGLHASRQQIVFGEGHPRAQVMFIGEAPGAMEDRSGHPFVGPAGQLLTNIIEKGMGLRRDEVYIANILKCCPPGNRDPLPDEVASCIGFLQAQIRAIEPAVIIALGQVAAQNLLQTSEPISRLRGRFVQYQGIALMPTYHPSYLLKNPIKKRDVWEDIKQVMASIGLDLPQSR